MKTQASGDHPVGVEIGKAVVLLLAGVGVLYLVVSGIHDARPHGQPSTGSVGPPVTVPSASRPSTLPVTLPATVAAATSRMATWQPPRFTERQWERNAMVEVIRRYGLRDEAVLKAMAAVPRHEFVPERFSRYAYSDRPLPIGYGQTISQPYMVAEMTSLLGLKPGDRVLEIGTGSGYQAAVLSEFTRNVYTIEIIKPLAEAARRRLKRLGYDVVRVRVGDGYYGWREKSPFDAIIVTCAAGQIPPPLVDQLAPGGRMVIPVGSPGAFQELILLEKDARGRIRSRSLMAVRFVPMTRNSGRPE